MSPLASSRIAWAFSLAALILVSPGGSPSASAQESATGHYLNEVAHELAEEIQALPEGLFNALPIHMNRDDLARVIKDVRHEPNTVEFGLNSSAIPEPRSFSYKVVPEKPPGYIRALKPYFDNYSDPAVRRPKFAPQAQDFTQAARPWTFTQPRYFLKWQLLHEALHLFGYRESLALPTSRAFGQTFAYIELPKAYPQLLNSKAISASSEMGCGPGTSESLNVGLQNCRDKLGHLSLQGQNSATTWILVAYVPMNLLGEGASHAGFNEKTYWYNPQLGELWLKARYSPNEELATFGDPSLICDTISPLSGKSGSAAVTRRALGKFMPPRPEQIGRAISAGLAPLQVSGHLGASDRGNFDSYTQPDFNFEMETLCVSEVN